MTHPARRTTRGAPFFAAYPPDFDGTLYFLRRGWYTELINTKGAQCHG